jgi:hypothetical protein
MEVLQRTANRGSISTGGYDIDNSLKVESDNREYLRWTNFSTYASSARKKKFSMSLWCKRTELGSQQIIWSTASNGYLSFEADDEIKWYQTYSGVQKQLNTNRVFRDTSAWYNIIIAVDSTQATEANRMRLYVNGVEETSFVTATYPSQNDEAQNIYEQHLVLGEWGGGASGFNGYIADYLFVSEVQLVPSDVGEVDEDSGIWKPKAYSGTISSPSQFLEFQDGSDLGTATSGLDADTMNNIAAADQATDTPTNNFQTFLSDGSIFNSGTNNITFSEGGTKFSKGSSTSWTTAYTNIAMTNGKWYMEFKNYSTGDNTFFGLTPVARTTSSVAQNYYTGQASDGSTGYYMNNGQIYWQGSSSGGVTSATGDIIGVAVDIDNNKAYWHKNGTYMNSADPAAGSNGSTINDEPYFFACSTYNGNTSGETNTGGYSSFAISSAASDADGYGTFEYAPPTSFFALCTKNLAEYG